MNELNKLYSDVIKTHNETPFHFEKVEGASTILKANNPICGDRFELYIGYHDDKISLLHFFGYGCAVSKASTSVLAKSLEGKSLSDALTICKDFIAFIRGEKQVSQEDFKAFSGVHDFPERYECATLAWAEMKTFLEAKLKSQNQNEVT